MLRFYELNAFNMYSRLGFKKRAEFWKAYRDLKIKFDFFKLSNYDDKFSFIRVFDILRGSTTIKEKTKDFNNNGYDMFELDNDKYEYNNDLNEIKALKNHIKEKYKIQFTFKHFGIHKTETGVFVKTTIDIIYKNHILGRVNPKRKICRMRAKYGRHHKLDFPYIKPKYFEHYVRMLNLNPYSMYFCGDLFYLETKANAICNSKLFIKDVNYIIANYINKKNRYIYDDY